MNRRFRSKVDAFIVVASLLPLVLMITFFATIKPSYVGISMLAPSCLTLSMLLNTHYTVTTNNKLIVVCGFAKRVVNIDAIKTIKQSKSWLSAYTLSTDRLEIKYNRFDCIVISPKSKQVFINTLQTINSSIEIVV